jgi:hypothetical protein
MKEKFRKIAGSPKRPTFSKKKKSSNYSHVKSGFREDLGFKVNSKMEANYARYLKFLQLNGQIKGWEYEPETFWFESIRRGVRSYKPDFKVHLNDGTYEWHETKGYMDNRSQTKLKRFAKYYPKEKMVLIEYPRYKAIEKTVKGLIPHWE